MYEENKIEVKTEIAVKSEFTMGGIPWTVIQTTEGWVKCIASEIVEERAFDAKDRNDFAISDIREYLNGEFLKKLIGAGAPEEMFEYFNIDLTADDGLKKYGGDRVRIGLITCEEYRLFRDYVPPVDGWWWTATADSPTNPYVRIVYSDGSLDSLVSAYYEVGGVRPLCCLKSEILVSYLTGANKQRAEAVDMMKHIADAVPVVRGEWIHGCHDGAGTEFCYCSECNEDALKDKSGYTEFSAFCPSCGAKMDGEKEGV